MSAWRPGQKEAVIEQARKRGMMAGVEAPRQPAQMRCTSIPDPPKRTGKRRKQMNKTEARFAAILDAKVARGEITRHVFEGIAFRWAGTVEAPPMLFSPDFYVLDASGVLLIEVKGAHVYSRDLVRFKGCRSDWPEFRWEMWQLKKGEWNRIH